MSYPIELTQTYEVYEQIGAGGGGTVYRGLQKRLNKQVVIKKLRGTAATSLQDCRTEVEILKNLRHSYLPQVHDFFDSSEGIFTVMDFIPGKSLQNMLDEGHTFTEKEVLKYTKQLCEALHYLHSQKPPIVHGDIKPDNIMVTPEGNICLIDFNISGMLEGKGAVTFGYTPGYSAPEQVEAFHKLQQQMKQEVKKKFCSEQKVSHEQKKDSKQILYSEETVLLEENTVLLSEDTEKTILLQENEFLQEAAVTTESLVQKKLETVENRQITGICIDKRSDVYSLGATVYTLLTGKWYESQKQTIENLMISDGFSMLLAKALDTLPNKRYQDAGAVLQALTELHKKDKRYRRLLRRQIVLVIVTMLCAGGFAVMSYQGYQMLREEKAQAVYAEALELYEQRVYEESLAFLLKEALGDVSAYDRGTLGNLYYLTADCFFEIGEYEAAVSYYEKAVLYNADSVEYYCNYAISFARLGKEEKAMEVIHVAIQKGMTVDKIYLMQGELMIAQNNVVQAIENLEECIAETEDAYVLARAYMVYSDVFAKQKGYLQNEELLLQNREVLIRAEAELEKEYKPLVLERLIEAGGALYDLTADISYAEQAILYAEQMRSMGWNTFDICLNLGMLYESTGQFEQSYAVYEECLERYGENYAVYKKMAFLELAVQSSLVAEQRDYAKFCTQYDKTMELYAQTGKQLDQDTELALLKDNYTALLNGGWIQE